MNRSRIYALLVALALVASASLGARASSFSGASSGVTPSGAKVTLTSNQSLANNGSTDISWNSGSSIYDTDSWYSFAGAPKRLTCPAGRAGKYQVSGAIVFAADSAGRRLIEIDQFNSGGVVLDSIAVDANATTLGPSILNVSGTFNMSAGDYVVMLGNLSVASGAVNATGESRTFMSVARIGN